MLPCTFSNGTLSYNPDGKNKYGLRNVSSLGIIPRCDSVKPLG
jgi:hypothetical protein